MTATPNWAKFWAVELHAHTRDSYDGADADFGSAEDMVTIGQVPTL